MIEDCVRFIMPDDEELQFLAVAALQTFVDCRKTVEGYVMRVDVQPASVLGRFERAGLKFASPISGFVGKADMLVDLSTERFRLFENTGRHAGQVASMMCGVTCPPFPVLRVLSPWTASPRWYTLPGSEDLCESLPVLSEEKLLDLETMQITGVVGRASWMTFMAASYGVAVVEVVSSTRPREWLSKWSNVCYRVVIEGERTGQIESAMASVQGEIDKRVEHIRGKLSTVQAKQFRRQS